jgi:hypothetical protein
MNLYILNQEKWELSYKGKKKKRNLFTKFHATLLTWQTGKQKQSEKKNILQ